MKKYWLWFGLATPIIVLVVSFLLLPIGREISAALILIPFLLTGTMEIAFPPESFCKDVSNCINESPDALALTILMVGWVIFYFFIGALIGWMYGKIRKHKRLA